MVEKNQSEMGFLEHLEELRWRLVKSLLAIITGSILSFWKHGFYLKDITRTYKNDFYSN